MTSLAEKQTCIKKVTFPDRWDRVFEEQGYSGINHPKFSKIVNTVKAVLKEKLVSPGIDIDTLFEKVGKEIGRSPRTVRNAVKTFYQNGFPCKEFTEETFIKDALEKYFELRGLKETNSAKPKQKSPYNHTSSAHIPSRQLPETSQIQRAKELKYKIFQADDMYRREDGKTIAEIAEYFRKTEDEIDCWLFTPDEIDCWLFTLMGYIREDNAPARAEALKKFKAYKEFGDQE